MSETMPILPLTDAPARQTPTVYFIDDSATMREVIKIAFRRENFNVITCADAASALAQFDQNPPDVVITDVIMPDTDGYSVCNQIREHFSNPINDKASNEAYLNSCERAAFSTMVSWFRPRFPERESG